MGNQYQDRPVCPTGRTCLEPVGPTDRIGLGSSLTGLDAVRTDGEAVGLDLHMGDRSVEPVGSIGRTDRSEGFSQGSDRQFSKMMTSC